MNSHVFKERLELDSDARHKSAENKQWFIKSTQKKPKRRTLRGKQDNWKCSNEGSQNKGGTCDGRATTELSMAGWRVTHVLSRKTSTHTRQTWTAQALSWLPTHKIPHQQTDKQLLLRGHQHRQQPTPPYTSLKEEYHSSSLTLCCTRFFAHYCFYFKRPAVFLLHCVWVSCSRSIFFFAGFF